MTDHDSTHGFAESTWAAAKVQAREAITAVARRRDVITYSDLVRAITVCSLAPNDPRLDRLLGEISTEEDRAGRGMLTAAVVHKSPDHKPGRGFFRLAKSLGRDTADADRFWIDELTRVHDIWSR